MDQLAEPGSALRFEVDTVFMAADVQTQALCTPTQVRATLHHLVHPTGASAGRIFQAEAAMRNA